MYRHAHMPSQGPGATLNFTAAILGLQSVGISPPSALLTLLFCTFRRFYCALFKQPTNNQQTINEDPKDLEKLQNVKNSINREDEFT